jgi:hypothetical protein
VSELIFWRVKTNISASICTLLASALLAQTCFSSDSQTQYGRYRWSSSGAPHAASGACSDKANQVREWQFWRTPTRMEISSGGLREIWELQANGSIWSAQINVSDKSFLEYAPIDTRALQPEQNWQRVHNLLDLAQLQKLDPGKVRTSTFGAFETYRFKPKNSKAGLTLDWLVDSELPLSWRKKTLCGQEQLKLIELREGFPAGNPPSTEQLLSNYLRVDVADIGDREMDPKVKRLVALFMPGHLHETLELDAQHLHQPN